MVRLHKASLAHFLEDVLFIVAAPTLLLFLLPYTRIRVLVKKNLKTKPTILWAPLPIINVSVNRQADRLMGYHSDCLVYSPYHISQSTKFDYNLKRYLHLPQSGSWLPYIVIIFTALRYDILHFFYDGGFFRGNLFLNYWEIVFWRLMGKRIILSAYGADVRTEEITKKLGKYHAFTDMNPEQIRSELQLTDNQILSRTRWMIKWANVSLSMGDMIEYTPGSKNDVFYWAIDTQAHIPVYQTNDPEIVVAHAPNHQLYKGTRYLLEVIEQLRHNGIKVKLDLIQKMTNAEAIEHYQKADIIADQFIIGWHGYFAVEAMALGKPVLCYIRKKEYLPYGNDCPIVNTTPDTLYENLLSLVTDHNKRQTIGKNSRVYAENIFSLQAVGKRLSDIYQEIW